MRMVRGESVVCMDGEGESVVCIDGEGGECSVYVW